MDDKKYISRGSKLVELALKQTAKQKDEKNGEEGHEAKTSAPSQSRKGINNEPIVIVVPAVAEETYNNQLKNIISFPIETSSNNISDIIIDNETEFDIDSLIQDEASQQFDLPLDAELISIDPYDTLNVILEGTLHAPSGISPHTNAGPSLELNKESGLDLKEKNDETYEPSTSESDLDENEENVDPRNITNDTNGWNSSDDDHDTNQSKEIRQKRKRAKRGKADKKSWVAVSNKIKRMKGEGYKGRRRNEDGKTVFDVERQKRQLKPGYSCKLTQKNKFKCMLITEERRNEIFEYFWNLDWGQREIEVNHLVVGIHVHQRTIPSSESRRSNSLQYHLKLNRNGDRIRVCKKMFLNSIGLGEWTVRNWVLENQLKEQNGNNLRKNDERNNKTDNASKTRQQDRNDAVRKLINQFLDLLPKLESHFCRKDTTKLYLESFWQSKAQLFREYKSYCLSQGKENLVASSFTFHEVFEAMNLGLFSPKKDQCDLCCAKRQGNVSEEEYNIHIRRKNEAREEKSKDKEESAQDTAVYTMDVQAVLLCPYLKASALYYRRKLKLHNFTLYNLKTGEGYCYLWDETEGGVNADEFATILTNFISTEINLEVIKHVIIYSDGCTNQNRNVILANALLLISYESGIKITQKYLEKGHTQMECDSIHSNIEKQMKNREIYSPAGYVEIIRTARLNPKPYKVFQLDCTFFKRFNEVNLITSIRPGTKKGEPVVSDLRCIQYTPDGKIQVKLSPKDTFFDLPRRIKKVSTRIQELHQLYNAPLPIEGIKFRHLQELKQVIPKDIHTFYDNLPHLP